VFQDIFDAILYFYQAHLSFEYELRLEDFCYFQSSTEYKGSGNEQLQQYLLSDQKLALQDLMEKIFIEGYK